MKRLFAILIIAPLFISCNNNDDDNVQNVSTTFNFSHNWDGTEVNSTDFNTIQYTNANGEELSIEKLRYLISDITFTKEGGETIVIDGYNLVDLTNNENLSYTPNIEIPTGNYTNVSFTFGFDAEDNTDGTYTDLNSATWNVPNTPMLGSVGGYHYMQLEGKFIDNSSAEVGYAYHVIRAADGSTTPPTVQETYIDVDLGSVTISDHITFNIEMNIAEWFKNPNQWDLNVLNNMLMPNFNAQIMMNQNGQNVFSLGDIIQ
ncbi:MbnP family protein [Lacinutrix iliipiscaria]|uniref:MbnP family protein n=1 Tax=Lacinutrix iliipiscaria TaxID=1230532 RepID=A0ABW5WKH0_9FLAO